MLEGADDEEAFVVPLSSVLLLVGVLAWVPTASAFPNYNDVGNGCVRCHSSFVDRGDLHDLHVSQMTSRCTLCHTPVGDDPNTNDSGDAAGEGCRGCHGVDPMPGTPNNFWGAGLRLHHANNFITECFECHSSDPTPPAENVLALYYMRADVNVKDSCNADGTEDWDADNVGLDNDGDNAYDGNDSDCAMGTTTTTLAPTTTTTMQGTTTTTMSGTTTTTMPGGQGCRPHRADLRRAGFPQSARRHGHRLSDHVELCGRGTGRADVPAVYLAGILRST